MNQTRDGKQGRRRFPTAFGCRPEDLVYSHGHGWSVENLTTSSHTGTHIDAPYHYGATSAGTPPKRIDEVPLEWCFRPRRGDRHGDIRRHKSKAI
ncbi:MAG: cyclase family protein [Acidobacteriia bacterium]|nr:cyclase family protein [Terriglobia bacterium]